MATTTFHLLVSRPPPEFTLDHSARRKISLLEDEREEYAHRLDLVIQKDAASLRHVQDRYERDVDARHRKNVFCLPRPKGRE